MPAATHELPQHRKAVMPMPAQRTAVRPVAFIPISSTDPHCALDRLAEETPRRRLRADRDARQLRRMIDEIRGLWRVSETLGALTDGPAALALVTRTVGELTDAEAVAVVLEAGGETVLASCWGTVGLPIGLKSAHVRRALERGCSATAAEPVCDGGREIGHLWIGHATSAGFGAEALMTLKTLALMTSLAVTTLRARSRHDVSVAASTSGMAPERTTPLSTRDPQPRPPTVIAEPPTRHAPRDTLDFAILAAALPAFPSALARLVTALDDPMDAKAIEAALGLDPALAALAIRAASSAACGRARPVATVQEAVLVLGARGVRNLAMTQLARGLFSRRGPIETLLWEQAIGTAIRTQMALEALEHAMADIGYFGGLLHNVGTIALHHADPARYERVLMTAAVENRPVRDVERTELGMDGTAITLQLLAHWRVPPPLLTVLRAPEDSLAARALQWAEHATLAANPAWHALRARAGAKDETQWLTAQCRHAARQLNVAEREYAVLEQGSRQRCEQMRELMSERPRSGRGDEACLVEAAKEEAAVIPG